MPFVVKRLEVTMKLPISWLKDYIDLEGLSVEEIARKLTLAGLEVDEIKYVGLPMPVYKEEEPHEFKTTGIGWDRDRTGARARAAGVGGQTTNFARSGVRGDRAA